MGLFISDIPNPINGCTKLVTSTSSDGRVVYALAGHGEQDNYADESFLTGFPLEKKGEQVLCNLHQAFGLSLTFHLRQNCVYELKLPDAGGKIVRVTAFLRAATLREIQVIADRTCGPKENPCDHECTCAQCQSSFISESTDFDSSVVREPQDRGGRALISFIPATVFDICGDPRDLKIHYGLRLPYSWIDFKFANDLGHRLRQEEFHSRKTIINVSITLAKPGSYASSHVIQCTPLDLEQTGVKMQMCICDDDMKRLHSRSEYWSRCALVKRIFQQAREPLLEGLRLRLPGVSPPIAGLTRVIFHGSDGIQHPAWVIYGTRESHSEISQHFLDCIQPKQPQSSKLQRLQVEDDELRRLHEIPFAPIRRLKIVCCDKNDKDMEGFNAILTLKDWLKLNGGDSFQMVRDHKYPREYGIYDNVIAKFQNGLQRQICLSLGHGKPGMSTEFRQLSNVNGPSTFIYDEMVPLPRDTKVTPQVTFDWESAQRICHVGILRGYLLHEPCTEVLNDQCAGCGQEFNDQDALKPFPGCQKYWHSQCRDDHYLSSDTCPCCSEQSPKSEGEEACVV